MVHKISQLTRPAFVIKVFARTVKIISVWKQFSPTRIIETSFVTNANEHHIDSWTTFRCDDHSPQWIVRGKQLALSISQPFKIPIIATVTSQ